MIENRHFPQPHTEYHPIHDFMMLCHHISCGLWYDIPDNVMHIINHRMLSWISSITS